jgi:ferredoxin--NADP+ reductase
MAQPGTDANPLRVAIIGSGPTGFYAADHLLKQGGLVVQIDMFDRLPTPFGLVRGGVAPDHQKIKSVTAAYDRTAAHPNFRFYGNVEFGVDITLADLRDHYHQIVYCTGAQTDRSMGIPGEDLTGSHAATEFVAWYNGHPDYLRCRDHEPLAGPRVCNYVRSLGRLPGRNAARSAERHRLGSQHVSVASR